MDVAGDRPHDPDPVARVLQDAGLLDVHLDPAHEVVEDGRPRATGPARSRPPRRAPRSSVRRRSPGTSRAAARRSPGRAMIRLPSSICPKPEPSSSRKETSWSGSPRPSSSFSRQTSSAVTTPIVPSYLPPLRFESQWEPIPKAGSPRGRFRAASVPTGSNPIVEAERTERAREVAERVPVGLRVGVPADRLAREREVRPGERLDVPLDPGGAAGAIDADRDRGHGLHPCTEARALRGPRRPLAAAKRELEWPREHPRDRAALLRRAPRGRRRVAAAHGGHAVEGRRAGRKRARPSQVGASRDRGRRPGRLRRERSPGPRPASRDRGAERPQARAAAQARRARGSGNPDRGLAARGCSGGSTPRSRRSWPPGGRRSARRASASRRRPRPSGRIAVVPCLPSLPVRHSRPSRLNRIPFGSTPLPPSATLTRTSPAGRRRREQPCRRG